MIKKHFSGRKNNSERKGKLERKGKSARKSKSARKGKSVRKGKSAVAAVIDLGSNSLKMTIARIDKNGAEKLKSQRSTVRISENMGEDNILQPLAYENTIAVLKEFNTAISDHNADIVRAIATEGLRKAQNAGDFLNVVKRETGIAFDIISGEREAELGYLGLSGEVDLKEYILLDTGGGSCEIVHIKDSYPERAASLSIGGVVLREKFLERDIVSVKSLFNMYKYVSRKMNDIAWLKDCKGIPVAAIGGSNKALIHLGGKNNFSKEELYDIYKILLNSDLEKRRDLLGTYGDRADIIIGGLAALIFIVHKINTDNIYISKRNLRDGILAEIRKILFTEEA